MTEAVVDIMYLLWIIIELSTASITICVLSDVKILPVVAPTCVVKH